MLSPMLPALFVSLGLFSLYIGIRQVFDRPADDFTDRLDEMSPVESVGAVGRAPSPFAQRMNRAITSRDFASKIKTSLLQANMKMTVPEYVLLNVGLVAVLSLLGIVLGRSLLTGIAAAGIGLLLPRMYVKRRIKQRYNAFQNQIVDVLMLLVSSLRGGYSLLHALDVVVKESPPPSSEEYGRVLREINLGLTLQQALANLLRRVPSKDLDLVISAINIQHDVGGNLAGILEGMAETIRERIRIHGEIRVLTTQQKTTGYILSIMPFAVGTILFMINPSYMLKLLTPGITLCIPVGALIGIGIGFFVIQKIVEIEV